MNDDMDCIPDDAMEDEPRTQDQIEEAETSKIAESREKHSQFVEDYKNKASLRLTVGCLAVLVTLAIVQRYCGDAKSINTVMEVLKSVATISLGFLFGRNSR